MTGNLLGVESTVRVTRGNDTSDYVVEHEHDDGSLLIRPQTPLEQMHQRMGSRPLSPEEFQELIAPYVGPPDDEG